MINKTQSSFSVKKELFDNWVLICNKLAINRSKLIENYIADFVKQHKEIINKND